jgi:hypothetical protein
VDARLNQYHWLLGCAMTLWCERQFTGDGTAAPRVDCRSDSVCEHTHSIAPAYIGRSQTKDDLRCTRSSDTTLDQTGTVPDMPAIVQGVNTVNSGSLWNGNTVFCGEPQGTLALPVGGGDLLRDDRGCERVTILPKPKIVAGLLCE